MADPANNIPNANTQQQPQETLWQQLMHGRGLSLDFFQKHWFLVGCIVAMLLLYIHNRYTCQTKMEDIQRLEQQLEVVKTERVRAKSAYMSNIRESQMQHRIDSLHMNLTTPEQPPYHLSR